MEQQNITVLSILALYVIAILTIGLASVKYAKGTLEDYYTGSREFKALVLFCGVFAANISAVTLIGIPGQAYHNGWIMWPYFVTTWAWLTPILFYTVGNRAWLLGKKYGFVTMSDVVIGRWNSKTLGYLVTLVGLIYTIPYLMTGTMGAGQVFEGLTQGAVPFWLGALIISVVIGIYVIMGGMRGSIWANTVQAMVFMVGALIIFLYALNTVGGPAQVTQNIMQNNPELLSRGNLPWQVFFSFGIIVSLAVPMFPQLFTRLLSGKSIGELKKMSLMYPFAGLFIFSVCVYIGMWAHTLIPGLEGNQAEQIIPLFLAQYAPVFMTGILGAAILAATMSTMDSQLLAAGTIFTKDILLNMSSAKNIEDKKKLLLSKSVLFAMVLISYVLALIKPMGIITLINWAFGGFACLIVPMLAALYWKRCTKEAAIAALLVSQIVQVALPLGIIPQKFAMGLLPGVPALVLGLIILIVVTYLTPAPDKKATDEFFSTFAKLSGEPNIIGKETKITV
ncbi:sodium:solute symporter family protein [Desulfoscipio gibsoniae]|uniref:Na+/proline symporter n=1 Tax=Desulfoscipio gibsoniae DSM 7213 TaxID=767817 RepID=R4KJB3_9FIRM|nr:sodium:solute symporter family protein [Desulfoscipio gibsoniae]AGL01712.1 Na+/proline symporter [Desulfoscipio gibsoniae DSM 7213]